MSAESVVRSGRRRRLPRFDLLEIALVVVPVVAIGWTWSKAEANVSPHVEAKPFAAAYGPRRYSEHNEEWLIRDFFHGRRDGVFVDVGASHYRDGSNTYFLESELGWSGLAIDPLREFEADYLSHRPRTKFRAFFVSDVSNAQARLYTGGDSRMSSGYADFVKRTSARTTAIDAPTTTLDDLLTREGIAAIDFLNIDIELWEPKALAGFDLERYRPALVCIEAHPEVRQEILDYFARRHYVIAGKYLRADRWNLYFTPLPKG
jgi:FkbM family methyltransferase